MTKAVTVVTGANGALGAAMVERLSAEQAVIALERSKTGEALVSRLGPSVVKVQANVSDATALAEALARAEGEPRRHHGRGADGGRPAWRSPVRGAGVWKRTSV